LVSTTACHCAERQILQHDPAGRIDAGIVEQHVEPAAARADRLEQRGDAIGVGDVARHGERVAAEWLRLLNDGVERRLTTASQYDAITVFQQLERARATDPAARARHQRDLLDSRFRHGTSPRLCS
jgi:hypothetical protein